MRCAFVVYLSWSLLPLGLAGCGGSSSDPQDCSAGERRCVNGQVEVCAEGRWTAGEDCPAGSHCELGQCVEDECTPDCSGRECGPDGCGGSCGGCGADEVCDAGSCEAIPASCGDDSCQPDTENCFNCPADCGLCCGNGECEPGRQEDCATCPADCGCEPGFVCDADSGTCQPDCQPDCAGKQCGADGCGGSCGDCEPGEECVDFSCVPGCTPDCAGRECGADGCGGSCGDCQPGEECVDFSCVPGCTPDCAGRECGPDGCDGSCGQCDAGQVCDAQGQCSGGGPACDCAPDEVCIDGACYAESDLCGPDQPNGVCPNGQTCIDGACSDTGNACSEQNPSGACPLGELCHNGACQPLDEAALCDDANACTLDWFDYDHNRCAHRAQDGPCSDGNACTDDVCVDGACQSSPIAGCVEPPQIDPYQTPTNVGQLELSGSKPAGSSIEINDLEAVPESPETSWSVTLNLEPGENVYAVRSLDQGQASETITVRVVYDITPPITRVSPAGGVFPDPLVVTVAADEPARVHYTSDGAEPDADSPWFASARTFRVFDTSALRFRALDPAGNWESQVVSAEFEISGADSQWQAGPALAESLTRAAAAVAAETQVLYLAGGSDGLAPQAGAYAYDPQTAAWTTLASLPAARAGLALVAHGGAVYALGGEDDGVPLGAVAVYDPDGDAWSELAPMPSTRFGLAAAAVGDRIYVFGGKTNGDVVLDTLEVYDPAADSWTNAVAQMPRPRTAFAAVVHQGLIYLVGGEDEQGTPIAAVDVYDPQADSWSEAAPMPTPRAYVSAGVSRNVGRVTGGPEGIVVAGGRKATGEPTTTVEELVIDRGLWRTRAPLPEPRHAAAGAALIAPGQVDSEQMQLWLVGGQTAAGLSAAATYYTRSLDYLSHLAELPAGRFMHAAVPIDGRIALFGGRNYAEVVGGWIFDPADGSYQAMADLPAAQNGLAAVALGGRVWAIGGADTFGNAIATVRAYDPVADAWTEHQPMLNARRDAAAVVHQGRIMVIGGSNNGAVQAVEIYDPLTDRWQNATLLPEARSAAVGLTHGGDVYLVGGEDAAGQTAGSILRYRDGAWSTVAQDAIPVSRASGAVIGDRLQIFAGRENGVLSGRHWSYDLAAGSLADAWLEPTRLLLAADFQAAATLNGEVYLFGGNAGEPPDAFGQTLVQRFAGRCLNGRVDAYEGQGSDMADVGGGCGHVNPVVQVYWSHAFGHHGSCGSWNDCGNGHDCAQKVCTYFGYGEVVAYQTTDNCPGHFLPCAMWYSDGSGIQEWDFSGCVLPAVYYVECYEFAD